MKLKESKLQKALKFFSICDHRKMMSDLNMYHEKMTDFVLFPLFGFTLAISLRKFDFESHWNTFIFFDQKKWCQVWLFLVKQCLIWFKLRCLDPISALSWEIRILNLIEIVYFFLIKESAIRSKFVLVFLVYLYFFSITVEVVSN